MTEWVAFYRLEPFGPEAAYHRTAILSSLLANINRDSKKKPEPFTPADFMPESMKPKKPAKSLKASLFAVFGHRIKDAKRG